MSSASGNFWLAIGTMAMSVLGGGLAMAWRLGRLEQRVFDLRGGLDAVEKRVEVFLMRAWEVTGQGAWDGRERRRRPPGN